jgi:hypothetical protein
MQLVLEFSFVNMKYYYELDTHAQADAEHAGNREMAQPVKNRTASSFCTGLTTFSEGNSNMSWL